jgi:hypothetical protein
VLYTFVIRQPLYISASSDVQLLASACIYFESGMENLTQGPEILDVMRMMQAKASTEIQNAADNIPSTSEAVCLSDVITTNSALEPQAGFEGLLLGYNFSDAQLFYDMNDVELGPEINSVPKSLHLDYRPG